MMSDDPKFQARLEQIRERRTRERDGLLKWMLSQQNGRKLLYWLIFEQCRLEGSSYHSDPIMMARYEGVREVGGVIKDLTFAVDSDKYILMMQEALASRQAELAVELAAEIHHQRKDENAGEL